MTGGQSEFDPTYCDLKVSQQPLPKTFSHWTNNRDVASLGTNTGAKTLPFQDWCRFKEAFAPELIARAIDESSIRVTRCIDPFGGSGTTGLACQFLGVHPILIEVNPYFADLIEAKLFPYSSTDALTRDVDAVIKASNSQVPCDVDEYFGFRPRTLIEPGYNERWIFNKEVAQRILALRHAFESLDEETQRLFRVLLGGTLIEVSNVRVSGKGRRYRQGWKERPVPPSRVEELFSTLARRAIKDIGRFAPRSVTSYEVLRGDSRDVHLDIEPCELAVFSPPYPNSSDYTDIYNVELWALGYLDSPKANSILRSATLSSHVQISRDFPEAPVGSATLTKVLARLEGKRHVLWDGNIPVMVGAYFRDLLDVLDHLKDVLVTGGSAWIVVGDSQYAGIRIPVTKVLAELVKSRGWNVEASEPFRSMRTSPQQGGEKMLKEQLLVLRKDR